jgi:hypothetical protein
MIESKSLRALVFSSIFACGHSLGCASDDVDDAMESGGAATETTHSSSAEEHGDESSDGGTAQTSGQTTSGDDGTGTETGAGETGDEPHDVADPVYDDVEVFTIDLPVLGDPTDVYAPVTDPPQAFPVALLLQGANVDKQYYAEMATLVARYGFVVAVPNHTSSGLMGSGLFMEQSVIPEAIEGLEVLDQDAGSALFGRIDTSAVGLLGHSYGGVVGVYALTEQCVFPFCSGSFTLPSQVGGGVFYGTNMRPPWGGSIDPLANAGRGIGFVQGTLDSKATLADAQETYEAVASAPAALVTLLGANHYGINDVDNPPGADPDAATPTLDQSISIETTGRWSALLLRAWVLGDEAAKTYLETADDPNAEAQLDH